ncbi:MAG: NAD(P)/FAD-dependent oxidoreductase [Bryobacteraceae bacterium]|nr:NAD(P)/FAD-dependent oxidoreductase [Bryobacteraceae bacterium]
MKTVAVLGGGPSGSHTAEKLAAAGMRTILVDEKLAWEKPCGGGITYKAYEKYPYLANNMTPHKEVSDAFIAAPRAGAVKLTMQHPLMIYARKDLNAMLLERAERAGAQIEKTRVLSVERGSNNWRIKTKLGLIEADFCVVATGARNPLKNVGTEYTAADTMYALGYYVAADQNHVDIQFLENLEGYIWVFPRCGHLSVGICGKGQSAQQLRIRLERYMDEKGIPYKGASFYGHMLPALESPGWRKNRVSGEGWMAVGDAGGLVDPITGEGLYYALRSSDLASQVLLNDSVAPEAKPEAYRQTIEQDFVADLAFGATLARRVFLGRLLFTSVPGCMVKFVRRSQKFHDLMQDLFAGTQPYLELKDRLFRNFNGTLNEWVVGLLMQRVLPSSK